MSDNVATNVATTAAAANAKPADPVTLSGPVDFWAEQILFDDKVRTRREVAEELVEVGFSVGDAVDVILEKQAELPVVTDAPKV